jgi:hypothetical protein
MKKVLILMLLLVSFIPFYSIKVNAKTIKSYSDVPVDYLDDKGDYANCNGIFPNQDSLDMLTEILDYFRILAPIALLLFVAIDMGTAVISQDNAAIKKSASKSVKRGIACFLLYLVPTIVRFLLNMDGIKGILVDDPLCGAMKSNTIEINERI